MIFKRTLLVIIFDIGLLVFGFAQSSMSDMIYIKGGTYIMGDVWNKPVYLDSALVHSNNVKEYDPHHSHGMSFTFDALDVHKVTVQDFYIAKHELVNSMYDKYLVAIGETNKEDFPEKKEWIEKGWERSNAPAVYISWDDAINFCNWLSKQECLDSCYVWENGQYYYDTKANGYRLPTEAEWEYVARGAYQIPTINNGKGHFYAAGCDDAVCSSSYVDKTGIERECDNYKTRKEAANYYKTLQQYAWFNINSGPQNLSFKEGRPHRVGQKLPNALGIYDLSGNAWEWCWDLYSYDYYAYCQQHPKECINPTGPLCVGDKGGVNCHVLRGGSWGNYPPFLRSTFRFFGLQQVLGNRVCCNWRTGLRLVRNVESERNGIKCVGNFPNQKKNYDDALSIHIDNGCIKDKKVSNNYDPLLDQTDSILGFNNKSGSPDVINFGCQLSQDFTTTTCNHDWVKEQLGYNSTYTQRIDFILSSQLAEKTKANVIVSYNILDSKSYTLLPLNLEISHYFTDHLNVRFGRLISKLSESQFYGRLALGEDASHTFGRTPFVNDAFEILYKVGINKPVFFIGAKTCYDNPSFEGIYCGIHNITAKGLQSYLLLSTIKEHVSTIVKSIKNYAGSNRWYFSYEGEIAYKKPEQCYFLGIGGYVDYIGAIPHAQRKRDLMASSLPTITESNKALKETFIPMCGFRLRPDKINPKFNFLAMAGFEAEMQGMLTNKYTSLNMFGYLKFKITNRLILTYACNPQFTWFSKGESSSFKFLGGTAHYLRISLTIGRPNRMMM